MPQNNIALVFPEYDDRENLTTSDDWKRNELPEDESIGKYIKYLCSYVDFYRDEECELIYDAVNASAFCFYLDVLPDCYPNRKREFRFALKNIENWRKNRVSSKEDEYLLGKTIINNELRSEIACRMQHNPYDSYLLVVHIPNYNAIKWNLEIEQNVYTIESQPMSILRTFEWLSSRHFPKRCYNWNPKHGENGKGAHQDQKGARVSVLSCSKEHAEKIMHKAIGLPGYDILYCFDTEYSMFMEYRAECKFEHLPANAATRSYHSYHLTDGNSIPNRVKKKIEILKAELEKETVLVNK